MSSSVRPLLLAPLALAFATALAVPASAEPPRDRSFSVKWSIGGLDKNKNLYDVGFADTRVGWAVGESGTIAATTDGGATWQNQASGTDRHLLRLSVADARSAWAVGMSGTLLATRDGGSTRQPQASGTPRQPRGVHFINGRTGWAVETVRNHPGNGRFQARPGSRKSAARPGSLIAGCISSTHRTAGLSAPVA